MTEAELLAAMTAVAAGQAAEALATLERCLGDADGFILSIGGTPLAPNPRAIKGQDGRVWIAAYTSALRAAAAKPAADGVLRAPMPVICATARVPGIAGVALNPGSSPWLLIQDPMLQAVATRSGSGNPITMVDPTVPAILSIEVRADGSIRSDGQPASLDRLRGDLQRLQARGGLVQYAREAPNGEPSAAADLTIEAVLGLVNELHLPVQLVRRATSDEIDDARRPQPDRPRRE